MGSELPPGRDVENLTQSQAETSEVRQSDVAQDSPQIVPVKLSQMATAFLRLGMTAFGGPAAHIAMMRHEFVERGRWLTEEEYLDLIGVANLIPGPSSTEVAIYVGYRKAGWAGLIIAGVCFILPAFLMVLGIAWLYQKMGHFPQTEGVLIGVKPVVIAVVVQALWGLGKTAFKTRLSVFVALLALLPAALGLHPLITLGSAGLMMMLVAGIKRRDKLDLRPLLPAILSILVFIGGTLLLARLSLGSDVSNSAHTINSLNSTNSINSIDAKNLFLVFLKIGAMVYGSGYVLLSFLKTDLVEVHHWLPAGQLLDSVAVGQVTPGPVFTTATFIGYQLGGLPGAIAATIGIFLPAFLLVGMTGPLLLKVRRSPLMGAFLDGVNLAALALMAVVACQLGQDALRSPLTVSLALVSAVLLLRYRVNSAWLVLLGGIIGLLASRF